MSLSFIIKVTGMRMIHDAALPRHYGFGDVDRIQFLELTSGRVLGGRNIDPNPYGSAFGEKIGVQWLTAVPFRCAGPRYHFSVP